MSKDSRNDYLMLMAATIRLQGEDYFVSNRDELWKRWRQEQAHPSLS